MEPTILANLRQDLVRDRKIADDLEEAHTASLKALQRTEVKVEAVKYMDRTEDVHTDVISIVRAVREEVCDRMGYTPGILLTKQVVEELITEGVIEMRRVTKYVVDLW